MLSLLKLITDRKRTLTCCCQAPALNIPLLWASSPSAVVTTESDGMPGQIPEPPVTAGSLPSLGPLAGISATTLTDKLKYGDLQEFGTMLSPLHFLDSLGKKSLHIKAEVLLHVRRPAVASPVRVYSYLFKSRAPLGKFLYLLNRYP